VNENNAIRKQMEGLMKEKVKQLKISVQSAAVKKKEFTIISQKVDLDDADSIKDLAYQLRGEIDNLFLVLGAEISGKPLLTIIISDSLVETTKANASSIIREAAKEIQGGGGGQSYYATAGGKNIQGMDAALAKAVSLFEQLVNE
jgi:alanyl-tRNA synthetase